MKIKIGQVYGTAKHITEMTEELELTLITGYRDTRGALLAKTSVPISPNSSTTREIEFRLNKFGKFSSIPELPFDLTSGGKIAWVNFCTQVNAELNNLYNNL